MIDKLKEYLIGVALQKYLPMAGLAAVTALGGLMAAHAGLLEQWGITYGIWPLHWNSGQGPSGPCILIELDTLSTSAIAALAALVTVAMRAMQHHTTGSNPQDKPATAPPVGMV